VVRYFNLENNKVVNYFKLCVDWLMECLSFVTFNNLFSCIMTAIFIHVIDPFVQCSCSGNIVPQEN
jgi:hypothetical protein